MSLWVRGEHSLVAATRVSPCEKFPQTGSDPGQNAARKNVNTKVIHSDVPLHDDWNYWHHSTPIFGFSIQVELFQHVGKG